MQTKTKHPDHFPSRIMFLADDTAELRDGTVVESNGELRLIRDEETGEEFFRFRQELVA
jgi:hypothetical protein